jgi:histidinol phosphatase-like PHP family hydrolase
LRSVAFTDHADFTVWTVLADGASLPPPLRDHLSGGILTPPELDLDGYQQCLERCRDKFRELKIWSGVELSEPHWHPGRAASLLRRGRFDLVVCGLHSLRRASVTLPPVLVLRSKRGKLLEETSSRMRCPGWNTLEVTDRSSVISLVSPG